jgi:hypothetical protein
VVHTHYEHRGVVFGRGGHDNLLGAAYKVLGSTCVVKKFTSCLYNVFSSGISPLDVVGVSFVGDSDWLAIDEKFAILYDDSSGVFSVDSVILR